MKAQVSFEFLIYTVISAVSLVFILLVYLRGNAVLASESNQAALGELVATINTNMAYQQASFRVYIPSHICNASVKSDLIGLSNNSYYFANNVSVDKGELCAFSGRVALLNMTRQLNDTFSIDIGRID